MVSESIDTVSSSSVLCTFLPPLMRRRIVRSCSKTSILISLSFTPGTSITLLLAGIGRRSRLPRNKAKIDEGPYDIRRVSSVLITSKEWHCGKHLKRCRREKVIDAWETY